MPHKQIFLDLVITSLDYYLNLSIHLSNGQLADR